METDNKSPQNIDEFIADFPQDIQNLLQEVRATIKKAAPDAQETIKYGIPTFTLNGKNLVHFSGYKNHIGFYPAPSGIEQFKEALAVYGYAKGTVRFPIDKPIPFDLISEIVTFRVGENLAQAEKKKKKNNH